MYPPPDHIDPNADAFSPARLWLDSVDRLERAQQARERLARLGVTPGPLRPWEPEGMGYADEHGLPEPTLVLAIDRDDHDRRWVFDGDALDFRYTPTRRWVALAVQTAGIACHQRRLVATPLTPTDQMRHIMGQANEEFYDSCAARGHAQLSDLRRWDDLLRQVGATCERTHPRFEEACYPIDLDTDTLARICTDQLPDDLNTLVEIAEPWRHQRTSVLDIPPHPPWKLYVVGTNSD